MTQKEVMGKLALAINMAEQTKRLLEAVGQELAASGIPRINYFFECFIAEDIMSGEYTDIDTVMEKMKDFMVHMEEGEEILTPTISVNTSNIASVEVSLPLDDGGRMTAYTSISDDNTVQTGCIYYDTEGFPMDLCMAEVKKGDLAEIKGLPRDNRDIDIYLWANPYSDDYTEVHTVLYEDVVNAHSGK